MWFHQEPWLLRIIGPNVGPMLISLCCLISSGTCLIAAKLVKRFGYIRIIIAHYTFMCIFLLIHLFPTFWLLLPAYILLGLTLGPAWICKWSLVVLFASRISCGQHECSTTPRTMMNDVHNGPHDDHKTICNRNERVRRLARWFHAIQDLGILMGALIASIIISCAATESNCIFTQRFFKLNQRDNSVNTNGTFIDKTLLNTLNDATTRGIDFTNLSRNNILLNKSKVINVGTNGIVSPENPLSFEGNQMKQLMTEQTITTTNSQSKEPPSFTTGLNILKYYKESIFNQHDELLDSLFNTNERGIRICGAGSCPTWNQMAFESNKQENYSWFIYSGTIAIIVVYIGLALIASIFTIISQQIEIPFSFEDFRGMTDTLLFAGPMAYFIGTEQGYVLGGFTRVSPIKKKLIFSSELSYYIFKLVVEIINRYIMKKSKKIQGLNTKITDNFFSPHIFRIGN